MALFGLYLALLQAYISISGGIPVYYRSLPEAYRGLVQPIILNCSRDIKIKESLQEKAENEHNPLRIASN